MGRQIIYLLLFISLNLSLEALNRDYSVECGMGPYCLEHAPCNKIKEDYYDIIEYIPNTGPECCECYENSIYLGYVDPNFTKYFTHLEKHLAYTDRYWRCKCYWPEYSMKAAQISDLAYLLFNDLISTTALKSLLEYENDQFEFVGNLYYLNMHYLVVSFIAQQFHFSDYYNVCKDISSYIVSKYDERQVAEILDKLDNILETLYPHFFSLYKTCYDEHPNKVVKRELYFMRLLTGESADYEGSSVLSKCIINKGCISNNPEKINYNYSSEFSSVRTKKINHKSARKVISSSSLESNILLENGVILNNLLLYDEAIKSLSQAILSNPYNKDAYLERAFAYFETDRILLALQDYEAAKKITLNPPFKVGKSLIYIPSNKSEYSKGLVLGTIEGAKIAIKEMVPSIFSCLRGTLNGLWSFACSPLEVSKDLISTSYAIGEFVYNHSTKECLHCVIPELKELSLSWNEINDFARGYKIGYIIGKYGIEVFTPLAAAKGANTAAKGISKVKALKRANIKFTLEKCALSEANKMKILEESEKFAAIRRNLIFKSIKDGKILVKSSNVQYHVMQSKHSWDKLLKLSGNVEEDFKKVVTLLENNNVMNSINLKSILELPRDVPIKNIQLLEYRLTIEGHEIQVFFEKYLETGDVFLKNGWVVTR